MTNSPRILPLTNAQKSIWQIVQFHKDTSFVNLAATVRIQEAVQYELLGKAINLAIEANEGVRTRILESGAEPHQYFAEYAELQVEFFDFCYPNSAEDLRNWEVARTRKLFDLFDSPLYDFALLKLGDQEGGFFFKAHHITADFWSMTLLASEIMQYYYNLCCNGETVRELKPTFAEHVLSELESSSSTRIDRNKQYWSQTFATKPEFTTFANATATTSTNARRKTCVLDSSITSRINEFSKLNNFSPFCILFSAVAICIWKLTSKTDMVLSTPVLNRSGVKEKNTMGMFVNNIPFRINLDPNLDYKSLLDLVTKQWKAILKHQRYPFDLILRNYREVHGTGGKLTDISFSFQNAKVNNVIVPFESEVIFNGEELNSLGIHVHDSQDRGIFTIDYDYLTEVFSEDYISSFHEYLFNVLCTCLINPESKISKLRMLSVEQERKVLQEFNNTQRDFHSEETIVAKFEQQVAATPHNTAIVFESVAYSYLEINERSNQLAKFLRSQGVKNDSIVGLIVDRSVEMIVAILAVLKAGGAYLPIDPTYPLQRIQYMLNDSQCQLLLTYTLEKNPELVFGVNTFDLRDQNLYLGSTENLEFRPKLGDLANVIYTSGSTGAPKGVMVEHRGISNLVNFLSQTINTACKTVLSITTVSFDIFFVETIFPLVLGMRVILANKDEAKVPYLMSNLIEQYNVDILQATPSRLKLLLNDCRLDSLRNLKEIIVGGESFPLQLLHDLTKVTSARIFNGYGPTETSIYASFKNLTAQQQITIGKPIANTQIYILDDEMLPVPIGVTGEIYISGTGLARGYVHNQELTRERFVPNPFLPGTRMYKTGDLAKWLNNGEISYLGRNDNQVKIRGQRIELGEIENKLLKHSLVKEALVICQEDNGQKKYLCAYLTVKDEVSSRELREYLSQFLPDYMVPANFVILQSFPLTPNGKIDKLVLPKPVNSELLERKYIAPRNSLEQKLVKLWEKTLEVSGVGIEDNLFVLGGDSLAILEILSGLYPNDWGLTAQDFYDYPTIRRLSDKISGVEPEAENSPAKPILTIDPSLVQHQLTSTQRNVLLTGATGFLGIHILKELLITTSLKIFCLIRGENPEQRLKQLINYYFPDLAININDRVVVLKGDITQENCGLSQSEYWHLAQEVSNVIHSAALVKHYGRYNEFYKSNVVGTQELISFCLKNNKRLNYISTTSVSGNYLTNNVINVKFSEMDLYKKDCYHSNVYVKSKFEAETLIAKAQEVGLDAVVYRVGMLTGRYSDGHFQKNIDQNAFYRMLKSIIMLHAVPEDVVQEQLEFTPVDCCAQAIVRLMQESPAELPRFHVFNHRTISLKKVLEVFESAGISIQPLPRKSYNDLLTSVSAAEFSKDILSGIIADPSLKRAFGSLSGVQVDSSLSLEVLQKLGFDWPEVHGDYLRMVLSHMYTTGFLKRISTVS